MGGICGVTVFGLCSLFAHVIGPHNLRAVQVLPCLDPAEPALNLKGTVVSGDAGKGRLALRPRLTGFPATSAWASSAREKPFQFSVAHWFWVCYFVLFCFSLANPYAPKVPMWGPHGSEVGAGRLKGGRLTLEGGIPWNFSRTLWVLKSLKS